MGVSQPDLGKFQRMEFTFNSVDVNIFLRQTLLDRQIQNFVTSEALKCKQLKCPKSNKILAKH